MIESLVAIIMKGRSVGVHVVLATQDPSTDTLQAKSVHSSVLGYCLARLSGDTANGVRGSGNYWTG